MKLKASEDTVLSEFHKARDLRGSDYESFLKETEISDEKEILQKQNIELRLPMF